MLARISVFACVLKVCASEFMCETERSKFYLNNPYKIRLNLFCFISRFLNMLSDI